MEQTTFYDTVLCNATIYDGSGDEPFHGYVCISEDKISYIGKEEVLKGHKRCHEKTNFVNCNGLSVSPGFINMLSWSNESLIVDGRSLSELSQGVTLEVMGESMSMGPWNDKMKEFCKSRQNDFKYDIEWTTLNEYLEFLVRKGVSCNVASFVGTATIRELTVGLENKRATEEELIKMEEIIARAMEDGAMGIASALIYVPDIFNSTEELIRMSKTVAKYNGLYISHMRSEGNSIETALDELFTIAREAKVDAEVYHLKIAGKDNWHKYDKVIEKITNAQKEGLKISADMYPYAAGFTQLNACLPKVGTRRRKR